VHEQKDLTYYLRKAEDYREKAKAVSDQHLKAALEGVAREYMAKASKLDPSLSLTSSPLSLASTIRRDVARSQLNILVRALQWTGKEFESG
jgi:hypothetical protein